MRVTLKGCHLVPPRRPVALALRLPVAYSSHHVVRGAQQWLALGNQGSKCSPVRTAKRSLVFTDGRWPTSPSRLRKKPRRQGNADRCRQGEGRNDLRPGVRLRGSPATLPSCPNRLLYAGNDLGRARAEFEAAIKHRPRIKLTIRQRTRVLQQWPGPS
jgi:hypothetical protein